ncbi:hypothetical protein HY496_02715 [Candidatus Woesearchaeota archaeon]|nr:hypothetical protein [Candidatus Woesearchaeota archaeon]
METSRSNTGFCDQYITPFLVGAGYFAAMPTAERLKQDRYTLPETRDLDVMFQRTISAYAGGEWAMALSLPFLTIKGIDECIRGDESFLTATIMTLMISNCTSLAYELFRREK